MTSIANKILIRQGKQDGRKYLNFSSVSFSLNENLFIRYVQECLWHE